VSLGLKAVEYADGNSRETRRKINAEEKIVKGLRNY
jgi:hypothetical protein